MIKIDDTSWHYRLYWVYGAGKKRGKPDTLCDYFSNIFLGVVVASIVAIILAFVLMFVLEGPIVALISHYNPLDLLWNKLPDPEQLQEFFLPDPGLGVFSLIVWLFVLLVYTLRYTCYALAWLYRLSCRFEDYVTKRFNIPKFRFKFKFKFPKSSFLSLLSQRLKDARERVCTPVEVFHPSRRSKK